MAASPAQVTLPVFTQRKILISLCQLQARIAFPPLSHIFNIQQKLGLNIFLFRNMIDNLVD